MTHRLLKAIPVLLAGAFALAACQTAPQANTGFLQSYEGLQTKPGTLRVSVRDRRDEAAAQGVERLYVEPAVLIDGAAEVRVNVDGQQKVVARIEAPGFFGEMGLMTGEPRTATVVAVTEVECYRLDKAAFHRIITERPELAREMSNLLANRKVELQAAKQDLDAAARARCLAAENRRMLETIQRFFGLADEDGPSST